ncbi:MAG: DMT family transporter [Desulfobacterales bacterium]|nr:DMT family transporter [Desulfobacterales bacterium]
MVSLLAAAVLWASSFVALKMAFRAYDPMVVIFGRMAIAGLCFLFFIPTFRIPYRKGDLRYLAFMAFCEPCLYFIFEAMAIENTTASQAGMICAMLPLMVAIAARIFLGEVLTLRTVLGFILAMAGVVWLSMAGESSQNAPHPVLGNFYEFVAMVCAVGYMITLKHLCARYSPFFLTAVQAWAGSLFFLPFLFLPGTKLPTGFDPVSGMAVIYLGTFVTLGAYGAYNFGTSRIPASQAAAFVNLIPVLSVIMGWVVLGERFTVLQYPAAVMVFAGIYLSQDPRARAKGR